MSTRFSVTIDRQIDEVFAYTSDMGRLPEWGDGVMDVAFESEARAGVGTKFKVTARSMGRTMEIPNEVTAFESGKIFEFTTRGSLPYISHRVFETEGQGTRVTEEITGAGSGFFSAIKNSLTELFIKRIHLRSLEQLKRLLEGDEETQPG